MISYFHNLLQLIFGVITLYQIVLEPYKLILHWLFFTDNSYRVSTVYNILLGIDCVELLWWDGMAHVYKEVINWSNSY